MRKSTITASWNVKKLCAPCPCSMWRDQTMLNGLGIGRQVLCHSGDWDKLYQQISSLIHTILSNNFAAGQRELYWSFFSALNNSSKYQVWKQFFNKKNPLVGYQYNNHQLAKDIYTFTLSEKNIRLQNVLPRTNFIFLHFAERFICPHGATSTLVRVLRIEIRNWPRRPRCWEFNSWHLGKLNSSAQVTCSAPADRDGVPIFGQ